MSKASGLPARTRDHPVWAALSAYRIGPDDAALPFAARLARENGWTTAHAERVIEEYHRFCFLAVTAAHPVTPSDAVDQAWHLHLTYTRDYWERFCPDVLGRPLHHGPTAGGAAEGHRFFAQYADTLASYEAAKRTVMSSVEHRKHIRSEQGGGERASAHAPTRAADGAVHVGRRNASSPPMTGSTTSSTAAIKCPPSSIEPPGSKPFRLGLRSPLRRSCKDAALVARHRHLSSTS